jgi:hypothetical protein
VTLRFKGCRVSDRQFRSLRSHPSEITPPGDGVVDKIWRSRKLYPAPVRFPRPISIGWFTQYRGTVSNLDEAIHLSEYDPQ